MDLKKFSGKELLAIHKSLAKLNKEKAACMRIETAIREESISSPGPRIKLLENVIQISERLQEKIKIL